jgi:hypothetical protein
MLVDLLRRIDATWNGQWLGTPRVPIFTEVECMVLELWLETQWAALAARQYVHPIETKRLERVREVLEFNRQRLQSTAEPQPAPSVPPTSSAVVDTIDVAILRALDKYAPQLRDNYDLEGDTNTTRKTIGPRLTTLIEQGLAERPKGPRKGATITSAGKNLLLKCQAPE